MVGVRGGWDAALGLISPRSRTSQFRDVSEALRCPTGARSMKSPCVRCQAAHAIALKSIVEIKPGAIVIVIVVVGWGIGRMLALPLQPHLSAPFVSSPRDGDIIGSRQLGESTTTLYVSFVCEFIKRPTYLWLEVSKMETRTTGLRIAVTSGPRRVLAVHYLCTRV